MNEFLFMLGIFYFLSFLFDLFLFIYEIKKPNYNYLITGPLSIYFLLLLTLEILKNLGSSQKLLEVLTILLYISTFLAILGVNIRLISTLSAKELTTTNSIIKSLKTYTIVINLILFTSLLILLLVYYIFTNQIRININTSIQSIILLSIISTIIIESIIRISKEIPLIKYLEDIFILVPILAAAINTIILPNLLTSSAPTLIITPLLIMISSISPYWSKTEENKILLTILLQLIIFILPIVVTISYLSYILMNNLDLKNTSNLFAFIGIILVLISTLLSLKVIHNYIKGSVNKIINKFIESLIPKVSEEKLPNITIGEILEYTHKSIEMYLGKNIIEVFSFDNLEKSLSLTLLIDGGEGIIDKPKKIKVGTKDISILSSKKSSYLLKSEEIKLELMNTLNSDIIIPLTYENELKFLISIQIDDRFINNSITNLYFSELFHWLILTSDSIFSKRSSKKVNHTAIIFLDNREIKQSLTASLIVNNFDVFSVNSYQEAIEIIDKIPIDIIITDNKVNDKEGVALIKSIKGDLIKSNIIVVLGFYNQAETNFKEFLESYADHQIILKDDITYLNNLISYLTYNTINKKKLESIYRNINIITSYSGILLNKVINYKSTLLEDIEREIIQKAFIHSTSPNIPYFIIIGTINSTLINAKVFSTLGGENTLFIDKVSIPLDFYSRKKFGKNKVISADFLKEQLPITEFSNTLAKEITSIVKTVYNFAALSIEDTAIITINYPERISLWDIDLLKSILTNYILIKTVHEEIREVDSAFIYMMQSLARAAEEMDEETGQHIYRVGEYSMTIAKYLGLNEEFIESIYYASQMHDIGKLKIPREILRKPGKLTPEEFEIIKEHTIAGAIILGDHPKLLMAREIALSHHEKWDGSGYPYGLEKENIPLSARITALADVYDALRSPRTYKPDLPHEKVYEIITIGNGRTKPSHFDPDILTAFKETNERFNEIYEKYKENY
ncbi:MAG: HD-GYP domain-containing protein [Brevinematia bacterium]